MTMKIDTLGYGCAAVAAYLLFCLLKRKRDNPKTSYLMGILNMALTPVSFLRLGPFKNGHRIDLESIMIEATKTTGLSDFGDLEFLGYYKKLAENNFYRSLQFSNLGNIVAQQEFLLVMKRKLKLIQFLKDVPSVKEIPVPAPVFIFGIGRSGTTYLHRLLSLDPSKRAPRLWELANGIPDTLMLDEMEDDRAFRKEVMRKVISKRETMGDKTMEGLHEIHHDLPEECLLFLSDHLPWSFHNIYTCLREVKYFLSIIGLTDEKGKRKRSEQVVKAFRSYKHCLQTLSYQTGEAKRGNNWVLKCPLHCFFVKEIMEVFPDAKLVWAHRSPSTNASSACSLLEGMHGTYYEAGCLDRRQLGKDVTGVMEYVFQQTPKDLEESVQMKNCGHVLFDDLVLRPIDTVRRLYETFGWEMSDEYEKILLDHVAADKKKRESNKTSGNHGMYKHTPNRFQLDKANLKKGIFNDYVEMYGLKDCVM